MARQPNCVLETGGSLLCRTMQNVSNLVVPWPMRSTDSSAAPQVQRIGYALPAASSEVGHLGLASGHLMQGAAVGASALAARRRDAGPTATTRPVKRVA